ncbi:MAG: hypothetical protein QOJ98_2313 [Acidobacteriota bacterium]|nr:hypothetical protein [Acidobacteriota bacterium]
MSANVPTRGSPPFARRQCVERHDQSRRKATVVLDLDTLTAAERRDLANAFLRAAWCAALVETRTLLLDWLIETDAAVMDEPTE